jgi:hypothetical protein
MKILAGSFLATEGTWVGENIYGYMLDGYYAITVPCGRLVTFTFSGQLARIESTL